MCRNQTLRTSNKVRLNEFKVFCRGASLEAIVKAWHCGGAGRQSFDFQGRNGVQYAQEPDFYEAVLEK